MGSKHAGLSGPDWLDLAEMLAAFEEQNRVRIEVSMMRWTSHREPDISLSAKAWELTADRRVAKPLAFRNVTCRAEGVKSLEGAITYLLYQLDFQLAEHEWGRNDSGDSRSPAKDD